MIFHLIPNEGPFPLWLGMPQEEVDLAFGEKGTWGPSRIAEEQTVRFTQAHVRASVRNGHVVEVSITPPARVMVGNRSLFDDATLWRDLMREDGSAKECLGFVVLERLGLALTGFHDGAKEQIAVTSFQKGRWEQLIEKMKSFRA
jgi:hypothetical protein